jgi:DNA ligase D-like protein (predicted polymerase)
MPSRGEVLEVAGREVTVSNPDKVFFPRSGRTKLDLVRYYLAVAEGALRGAGGRPMALKRYPNGAEGEFFFQKRAPKHRPDWIETVELRFPSGRTAEEVVVRDAAQLAWVVNLGCIDLNPHPVRAEDLDHPDELRIDLDPVPGVPWSQILEVAMVVKDALGDHGLTGWPKTSGSRGIHVNARIERRWTFPEVRRAALAIAREVERRVPELATSRWWKEERQGVFLDYNQNAKIARWPRRTRSVPADARVSAPLTWTSGPDAEPEAFTLDRARAVRGDRGPARRDRRRARVARAAPGSRGRARGAGVRRRAVATALRQAGGRAAARTALEAPETGGRGGVAGARQDRRTDGAPTLHDAADRDRGPPPKTRRWRDSSAGARATPASGDTWCRRMCSSTACAAARRRGRGSG